MIKKAIIVAGGSGTRMGATIPKQFLMLNDKPVLQHTIEAFLAAFNDVEIILVLPKAYIHSLNLFLPQQIIDLLTLVEGGETRFESVKNGLSSVTDPAIVFVHDAVRCLVSPALIQQCYAQALEKGSAIPAVAATDSIRLITDNTSKQLPREKVQLVQTPQTFQSTLLKMAFEQAYQPSFTDEANVVEALGLPVHLIEGNYENIKITRPIDLEMAAFYLKQKKN
ncbi:MAG: 2-C-methyl-D-erythritol 4-phosphate cytidylyltransferase [Chitinophagaceae bacterium]